MTNCFLPFLVVTVISHSPSFKASIFITLPTYPSDTMLVSETFQSTLVNVALSGFIVYLTAFFTPSSISM